LTSVVVERKRAASPGAHHSRGDRLAIGLMSAPALALIALFVAGPAAYSVWLSFTDTTLVGSAARHPSFVGLSNYRFLFSSSGFLQSLGLSAEFVFFSAILGQFVIGMVAALILSKTDIRFKSLYGAAILLPMVVPEVVASLAWGSMLAPGNLGTVNQLIGLLGVGPVSWLQSVPMLSIIVINIWRGIAFAMIMFQAGLKAIPQEVEEAARVDGASGARLVRYITLPLMKGPVFLYMLLTTISTLSLFGLVYFLTQGGPGDSTNLIAIYIYNNAFEFFEIGLGSAASVILLVLVAVLGVAYVRLSHVEI
jgi:multiple sugar transport system permease protein